MSGPLPRSSPRAQDVDAEAVLAFLDALESHPDIEMHSVMVLRHGHVVAEGWWAPYTPDRVQLVYSLSKSFTATAAAFAAAEGLLDLDDSLASHFEEWQSDITDPRSRSVTLRHAVTMSSGHTRDMFEEAYAADAEEPVRGFLLVPPDREPGSVFAYNQPCTYSLAAVIQRRTGQPLTDYLRPRLFDPLGIGEVGWHSWPAGRNLGFTGLHVRTEDIAKLGQLYLQRGRWGGAQLISEAWVAEATVKHADTSTHAGGDWGQGYGFQFWMSRHGFRGDGAFGQFCVVLPEQDAVVVTTARTEAMQEVLDAVWTELLPGLGTASTAEADERLGSVLAGLRLAPCEADAWPSDWKPWVERPFPVTGAASISSVGFEATDEGFTVRLVEEGNSLPVPVGRGRWAVSAPLDDHGDAVPVAASGGLRGGRLHVEVIFLETPHRLDLTCSLSGHAGELEWRYRPLGTDRLEGLRCPRSGT